MDKHTPRHNSRHGRGSGMRAPPLTLSLRPLPQRSGIFDGLHRCKHVAVKPLECAAITHVGVAGYPRQRREIMFNDESSVFVHRWFLRVPPRGAMLLAGELK